MGFWRLVFRLFFELAALRFGNKRTFLCLESLFYLFFEYPERNAASSTCQYEDGTGDGDYSERGVE
ncbi:MAG: hypothetical protein RR068_07470, partial [Hafnia sp.]